MNESINNYSSIKISNLSNLSISEILNSAAFLDLQSRNIFDVQNDIRIRGASYEQNLIMIDGVKINNLQTGHHNSDIPLLISNIDKIEILRSSESIIYGSEGFGGVINIITQKNIKKNVDLDFSIGSFASKKGIVSFYKKIKNSVNIISLGRRISNGYIHNTEYEINNFFIKSKIKLNKDLLKLTFSYIDKEFGAYKFYSSSFPNEWEHTKKTFSNINFIKNNSNYNLSVNLNYQLHYDNFVLERSNPGWYNNIHKNKLYKGRINLKYSNITFGIETEENKINSNSLMKHSIKKYSSYFKFNKIFDEKIIFQIGSRYDNYSIFSNTLTPAINIYYSINNNTRLKASFVKKYRIPTFTELYYNSPANIGNGYLTPEKSNNYEIGLNYNISNIIVNFNLYYRKNANSIDWEKNSDTAPWQTLNTATIKNYGLELYFKLKKNIFEKYKYINFIIGNYSHINSSFFSELKYSKYIDNILQDKFVLTIDSNFIFNSHNIFSINYNNRKTGNDYLILNNKFNKKINDFNFYLNINNILNVKYQTISDIDMPGINFELGVKYSL